MITCPRCNRNDCNGLRHSLEEAASKGAAGGVAAFFGKWPGDETDEEMDEILHGDKRRAEKERAAVEQVIESARTVMKLLGTRDGQSFMHRDAALHGHWKELRADLDALDAARDSSSNHTEKKP